MATMLAQQLGFSHRRNVQQAGCPTACGRGRTLRLAVRAIQFSNKGKHKADNYSRSAETAQQPAKPTWKRAVELVTTGFVTLSIALPAFGTSDTSIVGPSTDTLLEAGPDFSFTTLLLFTLLGYWLLKAALYISQNTPEDLDVGEDQEKKQQRPGGGADMSDVGHAHIRSYVDSSQPGPGRDVDARELRNASLARSAAFRVTATLKESQPRIHALVEELAAPQTQWPPRPPRNADVDFVAAMVYNRMVQERSAKGPEYVLGLREMAVLETLLLEEVAEKVASEQVAEFVKMAAQGKLHPRGPGSGADQHPHSHAH